MIQVLEKNIITASEQGMDEFLQVFIDAYLAEVNTELSPENMAKLNHFTTTFGFQY